jgi:hypothetical protein
MNFMLRSPWSLQPGLLHRLLHLFLHLFRRHVALVGGDRPAVAERVLDLAVAVAPEHVGQRHDRLWRRRRPPAARMAAGVGVVHVQVDEDRRAFQGQRAVAAPVGKGVGQHDARVADAHFGVHDLAAGAGHAADLDGAEGLFVELQGIGRAAQTRWGVTVWKPSGCLAFKASWVRVKVVLL